MSAISPIGVRSPTLAVSPFHKSFNTETIDPRTPATGTARAIEIMKVGEKLGLASSNVQSSQGQNLAEFMNLRKQISIAERGPYAKTREVQDAIKIAREVELSYRPQARAAAQKLADQLR